MAPSEETIFKKIYERVEDPDRLPWAHAEPTSFLSDIVTSREPGKAVDIGCGSGVDSVYLAENGWQVTAMDFTAEALEMTRNRAKEAGVELTLIQGDAVTHDLGATFDLVIDAGVLHNMKKHRHQDYRHQLLKWLKPDGEFVLVHFEKRHAFDWRPIGPRRVARQDIQAFFAPELGRTQK